MQARHGPRQMKPYVDRSECGAFFPGLGPIDHALRIRQCGDRASSATPLHGSSPPKLRYSRLGLRRGSTVGRLRCPKLQRSIEVRWWHGLAGDALGLQSDGPRLKPSYRSAPPLDAKRLPPFNEPLIAIILGCVLQRVRAHSLEVRRKRKSAQEQAPLISRGN